MAAPASSFSRNGGNAPRRAPRMKESPVRGHQLRELAGGATRSLLAVELRT
jgi:hypothetical protein